MMKVEVIKKNVELVTKSKKARLSDVIQVSEESARQLITAGYVREVESQTKEGKQDE